MATTNDFLECRVRRHSWKPTTVQRNGRVFIQFSACRNGCGTVREEWISARTGLPVKSAKHSYQDGYLRKGQGRLDRRAKGKMRLKLMKEESK